MPEKLDTGKMLPALVSSKLKSDPAYEGVTVAKAIAEGWIDFQTTIGVASSPSGKTGDPYTLTVTASKETCGQDHTGTLLLVSDKNVSVDKFSQQTISCNGGSQGSIILYKNFPSRYGNDGRYQWWFKSFDDTGTGTWHPGPSIDVT